LVHRGNLAAGMVCWKWVDILHGLAGGQTQGAHQDTRADKVVRWALKVLLDILVDKVACKVVSADLHALYLAYHSLVLSGNYTHP